ncbi:hypothetical protein TNCV_654391 [Trichonephila clavipes]|nr:hypothetical protein TNCV_654391 [Trichonephila clavipes]
MVNADNPQTLDHLEDNIGRVIADRRPQMLEKVIENWMSRLDHIRASRFTPTDVRNYDKKSSGSLSAVMYGIPDVLKDPWYGTYPPSSYKCSGNEVFN